eukprot:s1070_g14.t1
MFLFQLQVVEKDLQQLGYVMEWGKVDAKDLLLPQRRNRVYATCDVNSGQDPAEYTKAMRSTMESLRSDLTFSFDDILDKSISHRTVLTDRAQKQVDAAMEQACLKGYTEDIFIDISTSSSRAPEYPINATTCIRPSGGIYASNLRRCLIPAELWKCQGIWVDEFADPEAARSMLEMAGDAKDLAGNAFASTSCQAKLICSLVNSSGWGMISGTGLPAALVATSDEDTNKKDSAVKEPVMPRSGSLNLFGGDAMDFETPLPKRRRLDFDSVPASSSCTRPILSARKTQSAERKEESEHEEVRANDTAPASSSTRPILSARKTQTAKRKKESEHEGVRAKKVCTPRHLSLDVEEPEVEMDKKEGIPSCIVEASQGSQPSVLKRCRKKTTVPASAKPSETRPHRWANLKKPRKRRAKQEPKRKYTENPKTVRDGKRPCITISAKVTL